MIKVLTAIFLFASFQSSAQTVFERKELKIDTHHMDELGKELVITKSDNTLLPPGKYICNYTKRDLTVPISFEIGEKGKPEGVVACENRFKTYVKNGIIYRYEQYLDNDGAIAEEGFMRGDTGVIKIYNRYGQRRSEYWHLNDKTIYDYNCSYSSITDSIMSCLLRDDVKGLYIDYNAKGKITSKTSTRNLPKGVKKQTEEFDEKGRLTEKVIAYENGNKKTTKRDGSYSILKQTNGGEEVEEYTKAGKLINTYKMAYPMVAPSSN